MEDIVLARIVHGSHLFGLATEKSDRDYMSIVLPSAKRILMGDVDFIEDSGSTSDSTRKNNHLDIDDKQISLAAFLRMAMGGTLDMLELLNAPLDCHVIEPHPLFLELRENRERLASRNIEKIMGFCRQQAITYNPRKERLQAAQTALTTLRELGVTETSKELAGTHFAAVVAACDSEYVTLKTIPNPNGRDIEHLEICGKMVAETVHASQAAAVAMSAIKRYGKRVQDVTAASSSDWKSLSHALRIATEGIEYVTTGQMTLPVPNREHILDIKLGRVPLETVSREIENALWTLDKAARSSSLPEVADDLYATDFLIRAHGSRVVADFEELEASLDHERDLMLSGQRAMLP